MPTVSEVIARIDELNEEDVVFVRGEVDESADACVSRRTNDYRTPATIASQGFKYFLEVDVVRQVLAELDGKDVPLAAKVQRVIEYARFDA